MSVPDSRILGLVSGCVIVVLKVLIVRHLWNFPLNHGAGYFMMAAVPPGFYDGPGLRWLRRYRTLLVVQCLLLLSVFVAVVVSGRWSQMPVLAPVDVISFFTIVGGFTLWARRAVGVAPVTLPRVVVPLEARRLGDYISWPAEGLMAAVLAASWLLIAVRGGAPFRWAQPVLTSYVVLALLPAKILLVRNGFPLAPECTEEYSRWLESQRRHSLRVMDAMRWFFVAIFAGVAARHAWPGSPAMPWIVWGTLAVAGAVFAAMMTILIRGAAQVAAMGRDLRPVGSFQSPFRPASMFVRGGKVWAIAYCAGLIGLLVWFR